MAKFVISDPKTLIEKWPNSGNGKGVGIHPSRGVSKGPRTSSVKKMLPLLYLSEMGDSRGLKKFWEGVRRPPGDAPGRVDPHSLTFTQIRDQRSRWCDSRTGMPTVANKGRMQGAPAPPPAPKRENKIFFSLRQ